MDVEGLTVGQDVAHRWPCHRNGPQSIADLGALTWIPVETELQAARWETLLEEHCLGAGPLAGRRLRYLIRSDKKKWLGVNARVFTGQ
jgi:hypothetical protein